MFLSDAELAEICAPLKSAAAQKRFLRSLGLVVNEKPNGKPLVVRSHAEWVLSGKPPGHVQSSQPVPLTGDKAAVLALWGKSDPRTQPNVDGMLKHLSERKGNRKKKIEGA